MPLSIQTLRDFNNSLIAPYIIIKENNKMYRIAQKVANKNKKHSLTFTTEQEARKKLIEVLTKRYNEKFIIVPANYFGWSDDVDQECLNGEDLFYVGLDKNGLHTVESESNGEIFESFKFITKDEAIFFIKTTNQEDDFSRYAL